MESGSSTRVLRKVRWAAFSIEERKHTDLMKNRRTK